MNNIKNEFIEMVENIKNIIEDDNEYKNHVFNLYYQLETGLLVQQKRNNFICSCLYSINKIPHKNFYDVKHVNKIVKILKGNKYLRDKYTDMSIFCSKSILSYLSQGMRWMGWIPIRGIVNLSGIILSWRHWSNATLISISNFMRFTT